MSKMLSQSPIKKAQKTGRELPLSSFINLYNVLNTDEEGSPGQAIIRYIFKKLYIHFSWEADCRQEIIRAWLESDYDLNRPRKEILSYATRAAYMAVCEWRRSVLVVTSSTVRQSPEPLSISIDELFGEELERFVEATNANELDPAVQWLAEEELEASEATDDDDTISISKIKIPDTMSPAQKAVCEIMIERLAEGVTKRAIADEVGVTTRTLSRYMCQLKEANTDV